MKKRRLTIQKLENRHLLSGLDVSGDNRVTSADALQVINHVATEQPYTESHDVNDDGRVSALDALQVLNNIALPIIIHAVPTVPTAHEGGQEGKISIRVANGKHLNEDININLTWSGAVSDVVKTWSTVTILAGHAGVGLPIRPVNDSQVESPETITTTITPGKAYEVGASNSASVTIVSEDTEPEYNALGPLPGAKYVFTVDIRGFDEIYRSNQESLKILDDAFADYERASNYKLDMRAVYGRGDVEIRTTPVRYGNGYAGGIVRDGIGGRKIEVADGSKRRFTPRQMSWIVAHELGHSRLMRWGHAPQGSSCVMNPYNTRDYFCSSEISAIRRRYD